jgi:hypothetical protein
MTASVSKKSNLNLQIKTDLSRISSTTHADIMVRLSPVGVHKKGSVNFSIGNIMTVPILYSGIGKKHFTLIRLKA